MHKALRQSMSVVMLVALLSLFPLVGPATTLSQGPNLIQNPGFEQPYAILAGKENCAIAAPWVAWWIQGTPGETSQGYRLAPEYKAAIRGDFPYNRVRNGELAQQYFHSFGNFQAGVYQVVNNVAVGSRLRFEIWGMTWSCDRESKGNCDKATSGDPSPMHLRIGIDPYGGSDYFSPNVVWSAEQNAYDAWTLFSIEAVAKRSTITVMVYSYPDYRSQDNNVYLDDASLVVVAPPPVPTKAPTNTPVPTLVPTQAPQPTATPIPPTAVPAVVVPTCPPTSVPVVAPTCQPCAPTPVPQVPTPCPTQAPVSLMTQLTSGQGLLVSLAGLLAIVGAFAIGFALARRK